MCFVLEVVYVLLMTYQVLLMRYQVSGTAYEVYLLSQRLDIPAYEVSGTQHCGIYRETRSSFYYCKGDM